MATGPRIPDAVKDVGDAGAGAPSLGESAEAGGGGDQDGGPGVGRSLHEGAADVLGRETLGHQEGRGTGGAWAPEGGSGMDAWCGGMLAGVVGRSVLEHWGTAALETDTQHWGHCFLRLYLYLDRDKRYRK